jgi:hypothetical protein
MRNERAGNWLIVGALIGAGRMRQCGRENRNWTTLTWLPQNKSEMVADKPSRRGISRSIPPRVS